MNNFGRIVQPIILMLILGAIFVYYRESFIAAKSIHLVAVISWFAGLFYLPRLFVYHAMATDEAVKETFKVMEYKLFHYIMQPAAFLTLAGGVWMLELWDWRIPKWLHWKLVLVLVLLFYHFACWQCINRFRRNENQRSHVFYRVFNEIPTLLLIVIVVLVVAKPFI